MMTLETMAQPGSSITTAFEEAMELAKKLNCYIQFDFNGVTCCAKQNGNTELGVKLYHDILENKSLLQHATNF